MIYHLPNAFGWVSPKTMLGITSSNLWTFDHITNIDDKASSMDVGWQFSTWKNLVLSSKLTRFSNGYFAYPINKLCATYPSNLAEVSPLTYLS